MSRITGVTLLLVILVVSFYHSAASHPPRPTASHPPRPAASHHQSKLPVHVCGCTVRPNGKIRCLKAQKQDSINQIKDLGKCLCSKPDHNFKMACERFRKVIESQRFLIPSTPL